MVLKTSFQMLCVLLSGDITNWIEARDESQSVADAMLEYTIEFGMEVTPATVVELHCLARSLCPQAEIGTTIRVSNELDDEGFSNFCHAFNNQNTGASIDYGQYNIGIVINGIMFDFVKDHPLIAKIKELV